MAPVPLTSRQQAVFRYVKTFMSDRGYAPTLDEMARALGLASLQGVKDHLSTLERKGYVQRVPGQRRAIKLLTHDSPSTEGIPILGRVAAGKPRLAVEHHEGMLALDKATLGPGTHFALQVRGDSMIEAGIHDGDYVIARRQETADPGAIVVVLLGDEATVKYLRRRGRQLLLEAANPAYRPIPLRGHVPPPRILGRVVGLYRPFQ